MNPTVAGVLIFSGLLGIGFLGPIIFGLLRSIGPRSRDYHATDLARMLEEGECYVRGYRYVVETTPQTVRLRPADGLGLVAVAPDREGHAATDGPVLAEARELAERLYRARSRHQIRTRHQPPGEPMRHAPALEHEPPEVVRDGPVDVRRRVCRLEADHRGRIRRVAEPQPALFAILAVAGVAFANTPLFAFIHELGHWGSAVAAGFDARIEGAMTFWWGPGDYGERLRIVVMGFFFEFAVWFYLAVGLWWTGCRIASVFPAGYATGTMLFAIGSTDFQQYPRTVWVWLVWTGVHLAIYWYFAIKRIDAKRRKT